MVKEDRKGVVWDFGHQTSFSSEPVLFVIGDCTLHSLLIVAEMTGARLTHVQGIC